ncbi:TIGR03619 family F420-dependent LLM class oxidoreductase [Frankia sp. AgB32]|uniref:TIGR03619 family F420-dependent LLM class oxidoreductase n=1 Tax=Frankia sp. AgB32 TaxID=631119 RepID=UPI00200C3BAA|nr:TIGR03619 family F420-dependent LLM class oxidoreductase [Frankia sp. AgB32]MCK9895301.1 TIGR03619 family F420-dependent LLM class oxidoreductase [Frankia sp. AgB32]
MRIGVHGLNMGVAATGADTAALARRAEQLGYDSWWTGDHVVVPTPTGPASATDPVESILDPIVDLAYVAASTERLELGTGILVLPLRNPLVLAKQAASLDVLSGGRLLLGVGAGWLEPEMRAIGIDPSGRGARVDEYLDAMTSLWTDPAPEYHGKYVDFAGVVSRAGRRAARQAGPPGDHLHVSRPRRGERRDDACGRRPRCGPLSAVRAAARHRGRGRGVPRTPRGPSPLTAAPAAPAAPGWAGAAGDLRKRIRSIDRIGTVGRHLEVFGPPS